MVWKVSIFHKKKENPNKFELFQKTRFLKRFIKKKNTEEWCRYLWSSKKTSQTPVRLCILKAVGYLSPWKEERKGVESEAVWRPNVMRTWGLEFMMCFLRGFSLPSQCSQRKLARLEGADLRWDEASGARGPQGTIIPVVFRSVWWLKGNSIRTDGLTWRGP